MCQECKKNTVYKHDLCETCYSDLFNKEEKWTNWVNSTDEEFCTIPGQYSCLKCRGVSDPFVGCECEQARLLNSLRHMSFAFKSRKLKLEGLDEQN